MNFNRDEAIEILERTPHLLDVLLSGLSPGWLRCNEGEGTWNAGEVVDHLIEAENNNWIPRLEFLLREGESKPFPPFDRYAHLNQNHGQTIEQRLFEFKAVRARNMIKLKERIDTGLQMERTGVHPQLGTVTIRELLAAWAVHDLTHIAQIVRVMAKRYGSDVGPWQAFLSILK